MHLLYECAGGVALFRVVGDDLQRLDSASEILKSIKLKAFQRFDSAIAAVEVSEALQEGSLPDSVQKFIKKKFLKKAEGDSLAVLDPKLGSSIKQQLGVSVICDDDVRQVFRGVRENLGALLGGVDEEELGKMVLGLSHALSRHKIQFSPDKVDIMIVQAIALLDEVDKELNTYAMRVKEWYGWHFPEMAKIVGDNLKYAQCILRMGRRADVRDLDLSDVLDEDVEKTLKEAAIVSMGTELADEDLDNVRMLCTTVVDMAAYRQELFEYLQNRMSAIAPNLTHILGELVGARLIQHAGSLMSLSKLPASTLQILGAEKALFRALKTKHATPKYGLIFHSSLVGQAPPKLKGKVARVLAAKATLCARIDALGDGSDNAARAVEWRSTVEQRLRMLTDGTSYAISGKQASRGSQKSKSSSSGTEFKPSYNAASDSTAAIEARGSSAAAAAAPSAGIEDALAKAEAAKKEKKRLKKEKKRKAAEAAAAGTAGDDEEPPKKKRKKDKDSKKKSKKKDKSKSE